MNRNLSLSVFILSISSIVEKLQIRKAESRKMVKIPGNLSPTAIQISRRSKYYRFLLSIHEYFGVLCARGGINIFA